MPEYVLGLAVLVVGVVGAASYLRTQAESQVANQADCISRRPPPSSCQIPALPSTTTNPPPPTTGTTTPVQADVAWGNGPSWSSGPISGTVTVTDPGGAGLPGAVVWMRIDCGNNGFNSDDLYVTLVTGSSGTIDLAAANITCVPPLAAAPAGTQTTIKIYRVDSDPAAGGLPPDQTVVKS